LELAPPSCFVFAYKLCGAVASIDSISASRALSKIATCLWRIDTAAVKRIRETRCN
jgi:hypothetical protein